MKEGDLMRLLQLAASKMGARLFRQNSALAWAGDRIDQYTHRCMVTVNPGDVIVRKARPIRAGQPGMSDLGGFMPIVITADMVGMRIARYVQAEVKTAKGKEQDNQRDWLAMVKRHGGLGGVVRSEDDLAILLSGAIDNARSGANTSE